MLADDVISPFLVKFFTAGKIGRCAQQVTPDVGLEQSKLEVSHCKLLFQ